MGLRHWERRLATGANAVVVALLVVVALQLGVDAAGRVAPRFDLSTDGSATLLPETSAVLDRVEAAGIEVRITAFTVQQKDALARTRDRRMADFLRELEEASPRVRAELVDFDRDRLTAERLGVDRYGTLVVQAGDDRVDLIDRKLFRRSGPKDARTIAFVGEPAIAAGLEQLLSAGTQVVYALEGHGEVLPFDRGLGDLHGLAEVLGTLGLRHRSLDLLEGDAPEVPADAAAVLVLGPTAPLAPPEQEALDRYLQSGGGVAFFLDPGAPMPLLLERHGLLRPSGIAMDPRSLYPWEDRPLLGARRHEITEVLVSDGLSVVGGSAGPVEIAPVDGVRAHPLLATSRAGWVERGTERPARFDPDIDGEGPVDVAVAAEVGGGRLAVVGDLDLVADPLIDEGPGNRTFAAALVRWLAGESTSGIRLGARQEVRRVAITPAQWTWIRGFLGLVWPGTILGLGLLVRMARRRG